MAPSVRRLAAVTLLAGSVSCLGCARFTDMEERLAEINLPSDYALLGEKRSGHGLGLFGSIPRILRQYRAPRAFEETCEEVRQAVAATPGGDSTLRRYGQAGSTQRCITGFQKGRYSGGVTAVSFVHSGDIEAEDFVRVDVQITQH